MVTLDKEAMKKAEAIFDQLQGMSITSAQGLLSWCSDYLLNQPVCRYTLKEDFEGFKEGNHWAG